jgi:hypothetical protein
MEDKPVKKFFLVLTIGCWFLRCQPTKVESIPDNRAGFNPYYVNSTWKYDFIDPNTNSIFPDSLFSTTEAKVLREFRESATKSVEIQELINSTTTIFDTIQEGYIKEHPADVVTAAQACETYSIFPDKNQWDSSHQMEIEFQGNHYNINIENCNSSEVGHGPAFMVWWKTKSYVDSTIGLICKKSSESGGAGFTPHSNFSIYLREYNGISFDARGLVSKIDSL